MKTNSKFFTAMLEGQFREAHENVVRLPEANAEIFDIYVHTLYSKEIVLLEPSEVGKDVGGNKRKSHAIKLYIMADQYGNLVLQNNIIDECIKIFETCNSGPGRLHVADAWDELPESSKMRQLILDWYMAKVNVDWLTNGIKDLHYQFVQNLAVGFANAAVAGRRSTAPHLKKKCHYHEHDESAPKCKTD